MMIRLPCINNKYLKSVLVLVWIFFFCLIASGDVLGGSEEGANHSVRINITGQGVRVDQTDRFERLMAEGKRLLQ